jgi:hypothetical protein
MIRKQPAASADTFNPQATSFQAVAFAANDAARWDEFVQTAFAGTFLHTRRFLNYHGNRFQDASLLLEDGKHGLMGIIPAAADPDCPRRVVSHPGITYGGLLHAGALRGSRMLQAFVAAKRHWREQGFETLHYKAVPYIYHCVPAEDDLYALARLNGKCFRCDLSCSIDLRRHLSPSERRVRGLKQARKKGIEITEDTRFVPQFWQVVEEKLGEKYGVKPVHTMSEIQYLYSLFPEHLLFAMALHEQQIVGGVLLFVSPRVVHSQYIAANATGLQLHALDAVFDYCIQRAEALGACYFDFGTSNAAEGHALNPGLYQFKAEFGGGGVAHQFYELDLTAEDTIDRS